MAVIKRKIRKKLTKQLAKLVKKHGPEMALALVSGIVSALAADYVGKKDRSDKSGKPAMKTIVIRKRS